MNRMRDELRRDAHKDPAELEREIDATRAELQETLEELEQRLSPTEIFDQVMSRVRRDGGEFAGNLGQSVKENPVPALLTSIGIAWMMAASGRRHNGHSRISASSGMHESTSRMRESAGRLRERWHGAKEAAKHRGESAREGLASTRSRISGSATSVRERAEGVSSAARHSAGRARSGMDYLWHEQPLILGAIGLAAGAIAGAALPPTEQEDETLGAIRDRALERAKETGMESARQARERVAQAAEQAKEAISSADGHSSSSTEHSSSAAEPVHRSPAQNQDQRIEPNVSESPTSPSSPGTSLRY